MITSSLKIFLALIGSLWLLISFTRCGENLENEKMPFGGTTIKVQDIPIEGFSKKEQEALTAAIEFLARDTQSYEKIGRPIEYVKKHVTKFLWHASSAAPGGNSEAAAIFYPNGRYVVINDSINDVMVQAFAAILLHEAAHDVYGGHDCDGNKDKTGEKTFGIEIRYMAARAIDPNPDPLLTCMDRDILYQVAMNRERWWICNDPKVNVQSNYPQPQCSK